MLGEDRVDGPVTSAEIEAVAEPLGASCAILSNRPRPTEICPSGRCRWPRRIRADCGLAPRITEWIVTPRG